MRVQQQTEAFVFVKEEALPLRRRPLPGARVRVFSNADKANPDLIEYVEGLDYAVDYTNASIHRLTGSHIADWSIHPLYGLVGFDHAKYPDFKNGAFTVYAEYDYTPEQADPSIPSVMNKLSTLLPRVTKKLQTGEEVVYVVYGDSISTGAEASQESFAYFRRFADYLCHLFPEGNIRIVNKAKGGETSEGGASRAASDVVPLQPDLVSIGYGMNDQNQYEHSVGVPPSDFERNLRHMIETIRSNGDTDILLVTPCEPNPLWCYTSGRMDEYADVIRRLGEHYGIGVADVQPIWKLELAAGKTSESLLQNNVNHPNDYGHYLYFSAFVNLLGN
ncbi:SGNH/GDSL hydrolase family protein [Paenibacillus cymbidii]|uniref:SGNH/GDSL hydrolase family protein n=1 Tax=Paenibacillus cymbidii TaxID=1639034 RepID=UPI0010817EA7|nr:SGNH/GDSL hydrolase family protein [Paenibacillus cymbidii]